MNASVGEFAAAAAGVAIKAAMTGTVLAAPERVCARWPFLALTCRKQCSASRKCPTERCAHPPMRPALIRAAGVGPRRDARGCRRRAPRGRCVAVSGLRQPTPAAHLLVSAIRQLRASAVLVPSRAEGPTLLASRPNRLRVSVCDPELSSSELGTWDGRSAPDLLTREAADAAGLRTARLRGRSWRQHQRRGRFRRVRRNPRPHVPPTAAGRFSQVEAIPSGRN